AKLSTTFAVRCGQWRSRSTVSSPFRKQQTSSSRPANSGPTASSAALTRSLAASTVSLNEPASAPFARFPCTTGAIQFEVLRGVNQRLSAGPAPPRKPRQRAFRLVEKYSAYRIVARAFTRNDPFVLHQKRIAFREQPREMRFARRG